MLYKKYHRNFVKQFKKGIRIKLKKDSDYIQTTTITPPYVRPTLVTRKPFIVVNYIADTETNAIDRRILVFSDGRVNDYK
mgnify:CR=1